MTSPAWSETFCAMCLRRMKSCTGCIKQAMLIAACCLPLYPRKNTGQFYYHSLGLPSILCKASHICGRLQFQSSILQTAPKSPRLLALRVSHVVCMQEFDTYQVGATYPGPIPRTASPIEPIYSRQPLWSLLDTTLQGSLLDATTSAQVFEAASSRQPPRCSFLEAI